MTIDARHPFSPGSPGPTARAATIAGVQAQLSSRRGCEGRRCPLCGEPIRGGQASTSLHGTAVHERCRGAAR